MANSTNNLPAYLLWDTVIVLGIAVGTNIIASWILTRIYTKKSEEMLMELLTLNKKAIERMDEDILELERQIIRKRKKKKKKNG